MTRFVVAVLGAVTLAAWPAAQAVAAAGGGAWRPAGETASEHVGHTATRLNDGTVLVVGGQGFEGPTPGIAELYDPARNLWSLLPPPATARTGHFAVRLDDGRVLVAGGDDPAGAEGTQPPRSLASAELFDPRTELWSRAASMAVGRYHPTATILPDSRVLVAGGATDGESVTATAELYDPQADRWSPAAPMATPRLDASAALLLSGQVLVAGGVSAAANQDGSLDTSETYDYRTDRWSPAPHMHAAHAGAISTLLPDGMMLVAGGLDYQAGFGVAIAATDIYNPFRQSWIDGSPMLLSRGLAGGARLDDGTVLAIGGISRSSARAQSTAELFDYRTRHWSALPLLPQTRVAATVTALPHDRALVVGGSRQQAAQLFQPAPAAIGGSPTIALAVRDNLVLAGVTALLLAAVGFQAAWRRSRWGAA